LTSTNAAHGVAVSSAGLVPLAYHGQLKGHKEYIFRQSIFGSVGHIAVDHADYDQSFQDDDFSLLRIDTWCGKNLKYGTSSEMSVRTNGVRNACEFCFVEYDPDDTGEHVNWYDKVYHSDLPF
jgi:hypothetical protein